MNENAIRNDGNGFAREAEATACHELGHTAGLSHYDSGEVPGSPGDTDDCMINSVSDGTATFRTYNAHHINDHINRFF